MRWHLTLGHGLKKILMTVAVFVTALTAAAHAESAKSLACMSKARFTPEQWHVYTVTSGPRGVYRECMGFKNYNGVLSSEPPPGKLQSGQVVYVSCGNGKKRSVTGGNNAGGNAGSGRHGRTYGECL
jgi:hypothetical protein